MPSRDTATSAPTATDPSGALALPGRDDEVGGRVETDDPEGLPPAARVRQVELIGDAIDVLVGVQTRQSRALLVEEDGAADHLDAGLVELQEARRGVDDDVRAQSVSSQGELSPRRLHEEQARQRAGGLREREEREDHRPQRAGPRALQREAP